MSLTPDPSIAAADQAGENVHHLLDAFKMQMAFMGFDPNLRVAIVIDCSCGKCSDIGAGLIGEMPLERLKVIVDANIEKIAQQKATAASAVEKAMKGPAA